MSSYSSPLNRGSGLIPGEYDPSYQPQPGQGSDAARFATGQTPSSIIIPQSKSALELQIEEQRRIEQETIAARRRAQELLATQGLAGADYLKDYSGRAMDATNTATIDALNALYGGRKEADASIRGAATNAIGYANQGYQSGVDAIRSGLSGGINELQGAQQGYERAINNGLRDTTNELNAGLADSRLAGLYSNNYTPSADYNFRRKQGELALGNMASARGGRSGGAQLMALNDFNQNLASEDYSNWANRQQTLASNIDAQRMGAANQQAQAAITAGNSIAGARQGNAAQMADLYTGAGTGIGNLQSTLGSQTAGIQTGMGSSLADLYGNTANNAANIYGQGARQNASTLSGLGSNLAGIYSSNAASQANLLTGQAAQNANLTQAMLPNYTAPTQYAGQDMATAGQYVQNLGSNAMLLAALYGGK